MLHGSRVRLDALVRVVADVIILNISLIACLLIWLVLIGPTRPTPLMSLWLPPAAVLSVLGPVVFYLRGFYTKGRSYTGKYKAVIIIQAASLVFGGLAVCLFVFRLQPLFPRSVVLMTWISSSALLLVARLWAKLWKLVVLRETTSPEAFRRTKESSVLVIGGAGYIGSAVLPQLLKRGYRVRLLDCFLFG
jgi:FlaA1/EpsC-like NDP-sugar epimerase